MGEFYRYECGCRWPVVGPPPREGALPLMAVDDENLPFCTATWRLLARGDTKGVFQLESNLGRQWTKKLGPQNGEHMGALGALLRPGCIGGDTKVAVAFRPRERRALNCKKVAIRDLYLQHVRNHFHYGSGVVSVDEEKMSLFDNRLAGAVYSGDKPVYKVVLKTGLRPDRRSDRFYDLECTLDHRLLTADGWKMLCDVRPGERVAVFSNRKRAARRDRASKFAGGEKYFRDVCWLHYAYKCVMCDWREGSLDVNHLGPNRKVDNGHENLCFLCPNHHRLYSEGRLSREDVLERRSECRLRTTPHVAWLEFAGSMYVGVKDTYDLTVDGPHHNFIAGNVVVHNCLRAVDEDGVSMTERYVRVKNGLEPAKSFHPAVDWILAPTYGCLAFQEQAMEIAKAVAGFSLMDADTLRKAIGKKLPEEMAKVKKMFVEGAAKANVVSTEQAETLFGWIEASQRYSFNKCIADSEYIRRPNGGRFPAKLTVGEMYRVRNDLEYAKATGHEQLRKKWKRLGNYGQGLSECKDGRVRPNTVADIQPAGKRIVYRLVLENGSSIRVTGNHRFPTTLGEKTVDDLSDHLAFGDEVGLFVCGDYEPTDFRPLGRFSDVTLEQRRERVGRKAVAGCLAEANYAYTNGSYTEFKKNDASISRQCSGCGATVGRLELHHKDGNRSDSSLANLIRLCSSCHKKEEYRQGRTKRGEKGYPSNAVRLVNVEADGVEETYDVTMEGPNHNFVVGSGIVTCNSHAVCYGLEGYDTAYAKAHGPTAFYAAWLGLAKEKQDPLREIYELVMDAKLNDVPVLPPDLRRMEKQFTTDGVEVTFGLSNIKGVGEKAVEKAAGAVAAAEATLGKKLPEWSWADLLFHAAGGMSSTFLNGVVSAGGLRWMGLSRKRMLYEYDLWGKLNATEAAWIRSRDLAARGLAPAEALLPELPPEPVLYTPEGRKIKGAKSKHTAWAKKKAARDGLEAYFRSLRPFPDLASAVRAAARTKKEGGAVVTQEKADSLRSMASVLEEAVSPMYDTPGENAYMEENLLGVALTASKVEDFERADVNTSCKDFSSGKTGYMVFGVTVEQVRVVKTKKGKTPGQKMAFLSVADETGSLTDVICFCEAYRECGGLLHEGNCVVLLGERDPKQGSLVVKKASQMAD